MDQGISKITENQLLSSMAARLNSQIKASASKDEIIDKLEEELFSLATKVSTMEKKTYNFRSGTKTMMSQWIHKSLPGVNHCLHCIPSRVN